MDNRLRREIAVQAMDKLVEMDYTNDNINALIDDAYNMLEEAIDMLTTVIDEEENGE